MISDAKIRIYLCAPNNLPIFFACGAISYCFIQEKQRGLCEGRRRAPPALSIQASILMPKSSQILETVGTS